MTRRMTSLLILILLFASGESMAASAYEKARLNIQANRSDAALKILRKEVKSRPDDYRAWFLVGVASAHLKQYHQAIEAFRHVIDINPSLSEPHDNLAVIYNELGDVKAAVAELEQSLKKNPGSAVAEENLADLYLKLALKNYRNALAKTPSPQLEQRYMRLLQVRGTVPASDLQENATDGVTDGGSAAVAKKPSVVASSSVTTGGHREESADEDSPAMLQEAAHEDPSRQDMESGKRNIKEKVLTAVEAWRNAWSARDLEGYFSAYAVGFELPARFDSLAAWQSYKRRVIASKSYIDVELSDIQVTFKDDENIAVVKFFQKFRSNSYNSDDSKVLQMILMNGSWKIVREESVS